MVIVNHEYCVQHTLELLQTIWQKLMKVLTVGNQKASQYLQVQNIFDS